MKICVIGTGYVGLVTGTCFAEAGNDVICVDVDSSKVDRLNRGEIPIYEPGLDLLVHRNRQENRLEFTMDLAKGINHADLSFIAVGTPANEDGSADLRHVLDVARSIAKVANKEIILGTKSTVPVGTGDQIEAIFKEGISHPFHVFANPEFLKEGDAVNDFMKPDRIVVGINHDGIVDLLRQLYAPFTRQKERLVIMSRRSAELTKYAANAMLATRISFMNEMANLCEKIGANIEDVRKGIGSDPRIGSSFLFPGIGYGGSCFPKDVRALIQAGKAHQSPLQIIAAVQEVNTHQHEILFQKITIHFGGKEKLKGLPLAFWGLSFKANTDDVRESPALRLVSLLLDAGVEVSAFDPQAIENTKRIYGERLRYAKTNYGCLNGARGLVIGSDWNEFRSPDFNQIKTLMAEPVIFDGKNILARERSIKAGFRYYGVGV